MRFFLAILILFLNIQTLSVADVGNGNVKLSDGVINNFYSYITERKKTPIRFLITEDGNDSIGWFCPYAKCAPTGSQGEIKRCKMQKGQNCYVFAVKRTIRWKNNITEGLKSSKRKFSSKDSFTDVKNKLNKLGFIENSITNNTNNNTEVETTNKSINNDLASQIKKLKELLDAGVLTEDEFNLAKQKILSQ